MSRWVYRVLRHEGVMAIISVDYGPGQVAELPVRAVLLDTPAMDAFLDGVFDKHLETRDQLEADT